MRMRHLIVQAIAMLPFASILWAADPPSLKFLVDSHESAQSLVRTLELRLDLEGKQFDEAGGSENWIPMSQWQWARAGQKDRIRVHGYAMTLGWKTKSEHFSDLFRDEESSRFLDGWNPDNPPAIDPIDQKGVNGSIGPRLGRIEGLDPSLGLLMSFSPPEIDARRLTLGELVAESPDAHVVGSAAVNGRKCWRIFVATAGERGRSPNGSYYDVYIDPEVNFAIRRAVCFVNRDSKGSGSQGERIVAPPIEWDVLEFQNFGHGIFVPVQTEVRTYKDREMASLYSVVRFQASEVKVNQALSPDAFNFRFPENLQVVHNPPVNSRRKVEIWGPDNAPVGTIEKLEDLNKYLPDGSRTSEARFSRTIFLLILNASILALIAIAFVARRYYQKKQRSS